MLHFPTLPATSTSGMQRHFICVKRRSTHHPKSPTPAYPIASHLSAPHQHPPRRAAWHTTRLHVSTPALHYRDRDIPGSRSTWFALCPGIRKGCHYILWRQVRTTFVEKTSLATFLTIAHRSASCTSVCTPPQTCVPCGSSISIVEVERALAGYEGMEFPLRNRARA